MSAYSRLKIPVSVTIMRWGVVIFGCINFWQAIVIYQQTTILQAYQVTSLALARQFLALVWAVIWWGLGIALWRRQAFTRLAIPRIVFSYTIYHLLLLLPAASPVAREGWLGDVLLGIGLMFFSIWALRRAAVQTYFLSSNEEL